jgi:AraC-like DNA-binding protein
MEPAVAAEFSDPEELSLALRHTNVRAVQTSRGAFRAELAHLRACSWSAQYINFTHGEAACDGSGPSDRYAFIVPLRSQRACRLLGRPVVRTSIGVYAPGSEHADTSAGGHQQVVLMPPPGFLSDNELDSAAHALPRKGSHHLSGTEEGLASVRRLVSRLMANGGALSQAADDQVRRSVHDELSLSLKEALPAHDTRLEKGRPALPRAAMIRHLSEMLDADQDQPTYAGELARAVGVSDATLRRMFIELFGMAPARYLMTKRLYLARQRLRSGQFDTVGQVAESCGFWDQGRFAGRYKSLFGELPIETLRMSKQ